MLTVAEIIETRGEQILRQWVEGARHAASARGLRGPQLTNMISEYVAALGRSSGVDSPTPEQRQLIENHLSQRLRQGFDLNEVLVEFTILMRAVRDTIEGIAPQDRPPEHELARLFQDLHAATGVVTKIYSEHLMEDEQLEKRYARLIQDVVSDALHSADGGLPVRERLGEILDLVREALGADAAALLLYDAPSDRLIMTASTGFGDGAIDKVAAVTRSSFVGKVALEQAGVLLVDAADTSLDLGAPLRRAGIRSLLGVRLAAAQTLVGVLYVGASSARDFTPSDIRRLESLGDRITLHLDNAQLSARLRDQIAQLELFVDVLAHDLRGPVSTARMAAAMLREEAAADRVVVTNRLDRSLRRIERMVTDLLDAHRVAAGEPLPLRVEHGDVDRVVAEAIDELDTRGRPRVVVRLDGITDGAFDPDLVRRAIWNLVVNALKYGAPDSPVLIGVRGDERGFVVAVHNEGDPIPADQLALLFKPFARAHAARQSGAASAAPSGWGLGLALVAGCASAHGGSVAVDSDARGTTFRLTLPWQLASHERAVPAAH
jgi:signal transduction histidine kinase